MIEHSVHVPKQARHCIGFDRLWRIRRCTAPEVWRNDQMIPAELPHLHFVKRPAVRMSMQKEHQWSFARPNEVQADSITYGVPIAEFGAGCLSTPQKGNRECRASGYEQASSMHHDMRLAHDGCLHSSLLLHDEVASPCGASSTRGRVGNGLTGDAPICHPSALRRLAGTAGMGDNAIGCFPGHCKRFMKDYGSSGHAVPAAAASRLRKGPGRGGGLSLCWPEAAQFGT